MNNSPVRYFVTPSLAQVLSGTSNPNTVNGDPTIGAGSWQEIFGVNLPAAAESYYLDITSSGYIDPPTNSIWNTVLTWTFPPSVVSENVPGGSTLNGDVGIVGLFIQRSANATNMPNPAENIYATTNTAPAADPNWTTISTYTGAGGNFLPTTYTDTAVPNPCFSYRVILIMELVP